MLKGETAPSKGVLLFGPAGSGKKMLAKAVATEINSIIIHLTGKCLTETFVNGLYEVAFEHKPCLIFIDLNSIFTNEEGIIISNNIKCQLLEHLEKIATSSDSRVLIIGTTSNPKDLDTSVLRIFTKKVYVGPLKEEERVIYIKETMLRLKNKMSDQELLKIAKLTRNFSNSDLKKLCHEVSCEYDRELGEKESKTSNLKNVMYEDFTTAAKRIKGSIKENYIKELETWWKDIEHFN
jgi:SpoVK/Ycf46/Vps4 family AAA+-type ATPase